MENEAIDSIEILSLEMPENVIEEGYSITIFPTVKEPLEIEYNDELMIVGLIVRDSNQIENSESFMIFSNFKPEKKINLNVG